MHELAGQAGSARIAHDLDALSTDAYRLAADVTGAQPANDQQLTPIMHIDIGVFRRDFRRTARDLGDTGLLTARG